MLLITKEISIDERELEFQFILASGPGGQNVNKVATAAQLRFNVLTSPSLPDAVRARLLQLEKSRINKEGELLISARRFRSQERNRQDALERFSEMVRRAAVNPKVRKPSKPSRAAKKRRMEEKSKQARKKQDRKSVRFSD